MSTLIVAEAGVNHNGDVALAERLVAAARRAGADAVKFQTFVTGHNLVRTAPLAEYQKRNLPDARSQFEMVQALELDRAAHERLIACCVREGIRFLSTAFDAPSVAMLRELGQTLWKVASGELTNLPLLRLIGGLGQPVLLSTGMSTLDEVRAALDALAAAGAPRDGVTVLHCNTEYPTPFADVNLRAMLSLREALGVPVGYSDHTPGIEVPIAAVALGACVVEKHFTLDRGLAGPDHAASLEPDEFAAMVRGIRNIELALGDGVKRVSASEQRNRLVARKSLVAARAIRAGEAYGADNLAAKRPGTGVSPMRWDEMMGRRAPRDLEPDEPIEP